jgi:taurine dioxygenase
MTMKIDPIPGPLGARITGIDLREEPDAEAWKAIHRAWLDYHVLVFPGQDMTEDEQIRFSRHWGDFPVRKRFEDRQSPVGDKSIMLVSNIRKDGRPIGSLPDGEMMFHTDGAYDEHPYRYTLLHAIELPSVGGNTLFANMFMAYDTLPDTLKSKLAGCHGVQGYYADTVSKDRPVAAYSGDFTHPLFIRHEETGRTSLYVSRLMTLRIPELPRDESDAVLEQLFDHCEKRAFIYEHVWTRGDFVMWDNRCTNHARTDFPETERRLLRRTVIQGVRPEPACAVAV